MAMKVLGFNVNIKALDKMDEIEKTTSGKSWTTMIKSLISFANTFAPNSQAEKWLKLRVIDTPREKVKENFLDSSEKSIKLQ